MIFILDHDVAATVGAPIRAAGYKCHTVASAGLATASDDEVCVFAHNLGAVFLTHDSELIQRRRENTYGHHVLLKCSEWDAPEIVGAHLNEIVKMVGTRDATCLLVSRDDVKIYPTRWR